MPIIPVNEGGAVLYYEDSGAPPGSKDYHTIFLIHGFIFHSAIFRPLFAYAASNNLRFISVNAREYPGSSPLSDDELAQLVSRDPVQESSALAGQASEFARFFAEIIKLERFPYPREVDGRKCGGVSILAWSLGNIYLFGLLGNLGCLDEEVNNVLESYVTSVIVYDAPCPVYGTPEPRGAYIPLNDPTLSSRDTAEAFIEWVSAYWEPFASLNQVSELAVVAQRNMARLCSDPKYLPTSRRMTAEELEAVSYPSAALRIGHPGHISLDVYGSNARRALLDTNGAWRNVRALVLWADMSCAYCPWGAKVLSDQLKRPVRAGEIRRDVSIMKLENANHFLHYDDPERFVQFLAARIG
ncbi:alpha/beta-hydrolase [Cytidiella melzeri]|nr:alpha/beta-hydrolase [Cytidiella melzeri]